MTTLIDNTTPLPSSGDSGWGTTLNTAILNIDSRFNYNSAATNYQPATTQFFYLGANGSSITTSATNPFAVSPLLALNHVYLFEYFINVTNSSTGAVTLGWGAAAATQFQAEVLTSLETVVGSSTSITGVNHFNSTTNKAITGAATAADHAIRIRGLVLKGTADGSFPIYVSVASGNLTPLAGSWFRFEDMGLSTSGTSNISHGI